MEDIVALKVVVTSGPSHYFLTWGRLIDPVETKGLEELVRSHLPKFGLTGEVGMISVCDSVREASGTRYFYENFFRMCQKPIPFGDGYTQWASKMLEQLKQGREIYYLGAEIETGASRPRT